MPLSPVRRTVDAGVTATRPTSCRNAVICGDEPTIRSRLYGRAAFVAELPHLPPEPRGLERPLDGRGDLIQVERLVREVVRAQLHRLDRGVDASRRRSAG